MFTRLGFTPVWELRFHTNIVTVVFGKPVSQFLQAFCKGGKASLLILCTSICVSNSHTGVNPSLVNIQSTAVLYKRLAETG